MTTHRDHAGVIALPPLLFAVHLAAGLGLHWSVPLGRLSHPHPLLLAVGLALSALSGLLAFRARAVMKRARTAIDPRKPTTALVDAGPYGFTRNPMYLALTLLFAGIAALLHSAWLLLLLPSLILVLHYGVVLREERYLERKFGSTYTRYRGRVRRWF